MGMGGKKDVSIEDAVKSSADRIKKRIRRLICCGLSWMIAAILCIIGGAILFGFHAKYVGKSNEALKAGLSYAGLAILGLGLILLLVAVILIIVVKNVININRRKAQWTPPVFPYGHAPYPQQKLSEPGSLSAEGGATASPADVVIQPTPQA